MTVSFLLQETASPAKQVPIEGNNRPLAGFEPRKWLEELEFWRSEINFYHQLLKMSVAKNKPGRKSALDELVFEFAAYKHEILPELKSSLQAMKREPSAQDSQITYELLKDLEKHAQNLRKLKLQVFPHLNELQTIAIW